jgi:hypothetical protein
MHAEGFDMTAFADIDNLPELKRAYRRLAARWHPDRGGSAAAMQEINELYDQHRLRLQNELVKTVRNVDAGMDFSAIEIGYTVWVNGTECEVTAVTATTFHAVAKGRNRLAIFDRASGIGRFNAGLKASFDNRHAR